MMVGRVFLVLMGARQFGHTVCGVGGFTANFVRSFPEHGSRGARDVFARHASCGGRLGVGDGIFNR